MVVGHPVYLPFRVKFRGNRVKCPKKFRGNRENENKDNSFRTVHIADKVLSAVHFSTQATDLPFHADLLTVCP